MKFSWLNVVDGNGIGITLTGMLIVFSGLALISFFIVILPKVLDWFAQPSFRSSQVATDEQVVSDPEPTEQELLAVITLVLHAEMERSLGELTQLTISRQQRHGSIWNSAGKMRSLSEGGSHA